jgi:hypothetical protein
VSEEQGLSADRIRDLLYYDPDTGTFVRRESRGGMRKGSNAGCIGANGYLRVRVDGKNYLCHRLAWLYVFGRWPVDQIDHINGIRSDNRIVNLRECSNAENHKNRRANKNGNGTLGASWHKNMGKWQSQIGVNGKKIYLGYFDTKEEAHTAYLEAKKQFH